MLKIVHPSKAINGLDYNRETADRDLVQRTVCVRTLKRTLRLDVSIPAYIAGKLRSHDWDEIGGKISRFAEEKEMTAELLGIPEHMFQVLCGCAAKRAIYDAFTGQQIAAGNDSWAVPVASLFPDQYPDVVPC